MLASWKKDENVAENSILGFYGFVVESDKFRVDEPGNGNNCFNIGWEYGRINDKIIIRHVAHVSNNGRERGSSIKNRSHP